jgi:hypothetical protein
VEDDEDDEEDDDEDEDEDDEVGTVSGDTATVDAAAAGVMSATFFQWNPP